MKQCLPEPALWPAADGRQLPADVASHLKSCPRCSAQVNSLRDHRRQVLAETESIPVSEDRRRATSPREHRPGRLTEGSDELERSSRTQVAEDGCPARIGGYVIERLLRVGGQAEIYLARHPELGRAVVVKWAHTTISADPWVADQFTSEARLLAALKHPNLPQVDGLGIAADRPFLALEHFAGGSLAEQQNRPQSPKAAALLIAKVARALHAVHGFGRLHLDIQPDNILLGTDGEPRLIDFGSSLSQSADPALRRAAAIHGTPEYMAPEQLAGDADRVGVVTDLYALGAVLYELIRGVPPQPEIIWSGTNSPGAEQDGQPFPLRLRQICRRALEPDPQRRVRSALEFARELEQFAAGGRPATRAMLAGAVVLAVGLGTQARHLCSGGAPPPYEYVECPAQRTQLIAEALCRLVAEANTPRIAAAIVLSDGRCIPLSPDCGGTAASPQAFGNHVAPDLAAQPGTTLLLLSDAAAASAPAVCNHCDRRSVPELPIGTIARITPGEICVLAHRSTDRLALNAALERVQLELNARSPRFAALAVAAVSPVESNAVSRGAGTERTAD